jgi:hypothetical protein
MGAPLPQDQAGVEAFDAAVKGCQEAGAAVGKPVQVANDNSPGQIVISGDNAALEKAMELAKAIGLMPLNAPLVKKLDRLISDGSPGDARTVPIYQRDTCFRLSTRTLDDTDAPWLWYE